ncbi:MAG: penicillin-binding transpeptidase domain-containing protein, partial [Bacilli bacterium]
GNIYGVEQASQAYFGKSVKNINLSEATILAGMFKSPNYYRPTSFPERAESRRNTVLYLMEKHGYINKNEKDIAARIPVESIVKKGAVVTSEYQDYIDTVVKEIEVRYKANPYVVPMLIYTNMDKTKQDGLNNIMNGTSYTWVDDIIQAGVAVVDTHSGKILGIGAGRNREGLNSYNYATQIKRQPGSTAKPIFDYAPGIEYEGWGTYTQFIDAPWSYTNGPSIKNWDGQFMGNLTLKTALSLSRNIPALQAFQKVKKKQIIELVTKLGIKPEIENNSIHEAHALGAFTGVSPLDMASAYAAFSNGGFYYEPYSVSKIVYRDTNEEKTFSSEKVQAMNDSTAYIITNVLQNVNIYGSPIKNMAAKTGTTNYDDATMANKNLPDDAIRDSWLVGYTTDISIGMWYGYDDIDKDNCMHNIPASNQRDRIFRAIVKAIGTDTSKQFSMPSSVTKVAIEAGSGSGSLYSNGLLASDATPNDRITYEYYRSGTEPTETSKNYAKINTPTGLSAKYDDLTSKVTINWNKVTPPNNINSSFGEFGYNVYFNDTLLGFTDKTTYQIDKTKNPYGTYKVVAIFKNNSVNQSEPATFTLKKSDDGGTSTKYSSKFNLNSKVTVKVEASKKYQIKTGSDAVSVFEDLKDVTSSSSITYKIVDGSGNNINEIDLSTTGVYTITYNVKYKTYISNYTQVVTVN